MKRLFFKPSEPNPAQPITNLLAPGRAPAPNALTALCDEIKIGEPCEATLQRYRDFCDATGMSQSVEDLLSFTVHKHTFNALGPKSQHKTFSRLGKLLPQPFTLKELKAHKQPPNVREQLMQARKQLDALEQARTTDAQTLHAQSQRAQTQYQNQVAQARTEAQVHRQQAEQHIHTIDQLRERIAQQDQAQKRAQISYDSALADCHQKIDALTQDLAQAQEHLLEQEDSIERERENTKQFISTYLSAHGSPEASRRRRHQSLFGGGSRPTSMIGESKTTSMPEHPEH